MFDSELKRLEQISCIFVTYVSKKDTTGFCLVFCFFCRKYSSRTLGVNEIQGELSACINCVL